MIEPNLSLKDAADLLGITATDLRRVIRLVGHLEVVQPEMPEPIACEQPRSPSYSPRAAYLVPAREVERLRQALEAARMARAGIEAERNH